jgi:hypothetical protein
MHSVRSCGPNRSGGRENCLARARRPLLADSVLIRALSSDGKRRGLPRVERHVTRLSGFSLSLASIPKPKRGPRHDRAQRRGLSSSSVDDLGGDGFGESRRSGFTAFQDGLDRQSSVEWSSRKQRDQHGAVRLAADMRGLERDQGQKCPPLSPGSSDLGRELLSRPP